MSEEPSNAAPVADTPGTLLKQERERQGLAKQRVADDLHLSTQMIDAIESNEFSRLGAPVYARGHLRKYAQLLSLSVERVHELYQSLSDRPRNVDPVPIMHRASEPSIPMSPDSLQRRAAKHPKRRLAWIAAVLVLAIAATSWWWWHSRGANPSSSTAHSTDENVEVATNENIAASDAPVLQTVNATPVAVNPQTPAVVAPKVPTPSVATGKVKLRFSFNQESWIEVYDARGTRILYDVGQPHQSRNISVEPPAKVTLGSAPAVATEVNGRTINVPAKNIVNSVAHFTVAADGSVE